MTTNAKYYYQRPAGYVSIDCAVSEHDACEHGLSCRCDCHDAALTYQQPSTLERFGEPIAMLIGAVVFGFAAGMILTAMVMS